MPPNERCATNTFPFNLILNGYTSLDIRCVIRRCLSTHRTINDCDDCYDNDDDDFCYLHCVMCCEISKHQPYTTVCIVGKWASVLTSVAEEKTTVRTLNECETIERENREKKRITEWRECIEWIMCEWIECVCAAATATEVCNTQKKRRLFFSEREAKNRW